MDYTYHVLKPIIPGGLQQLINIVLYKMEQIRISDIGER